MAYTTIHPIKSTLKKAIDYICNPEKTDDKILISTFGCSHETADIEFQFTLDNTKIKKGNNLAWHFIQSFDYDEIMPEDAHKIGKEMADFITGGKHEYVLTTHIDKGHVHNHLMFCAADFVEHKKYNSNQKSLNSIQRESDRICRERGLSVIIPGKGNDLGRIEYTNEDGQRITRPANEQAKSWIEHNMEQKGTSRKQQLKNALDRYIEMASDFDDMLHRMEADGFTIKRAKYHSYKLPGVDTKTRFVGGQTLGQEYSDERIRERIAGFKKSPSSYKPIKMQDNNRINLIKQIESIVGGRQSIKNRYLTIANLKQAAKTVNFLTENNIQQYEQLQSKIENIATLNRQTVLALKNVENRLADVGLLIKNIETYQSTQAVYMQYRKLSGKYKEQYRRRHESDIIIHEATLKAFSAMQTGSKLPNLDRLRSEYAELEQKKNAIRQEYGKIKRQVTQLYTIKSNIDCILNTDDKIRLQEQSINR